MLLGMTAKWLTGNLLGVRSLQQGVGPLEAAGMKLADSGMSGRFAGVPVNDATAQSPP